MTSSYDVKGKVVMVTGANRGIGKALVEGFLRYGATKVYAAVRKVSTVDTLVKVHGVERVVPVYMDLSKPDTIREAATTWTTDVQVVVHNANVFQERMVADPLNNNNNNFRCDDKDDKDDDKDGNNNNNNTPDKNHFLSSLQHQMNIHVYSLVHLAQHYAPLLKRNGSGGALIYINSVTSLRCPHSQLTAYSASKAAAYSLVQGLRNTMKDTFVMSVHPSIITEYNRSSSSRGDHPYEEDGENDKDPTTTTTTTTTTTDPPSSSQVVVDSILKGLENGDFLVYTDTCSKQMGEAYQKFATHVIEPSSRCSN